MNKQTEQQPGGQGNTPPHYKTTTVRPNEGSKGPGKEEQQKPGKDGVKAPPHATRGDEIKAQQKPKKT